MASFLVFLVGTVCGVVGYALVNPPKPREPRYPPAPPCIPKPDPDPNADIVGECPKEYAWLSVFMQRYAYPTPIEEGGGAQRLTVWRAMAPGLDYETWESPVAGVTYDGRQRIVYERAEVGVPVRLVVGPAETDPNAVAIYTEVGSHHLGYLPRKVAKALHGRLTGEGTVAAVVEWSRDKPYAAVVVSFVARAPAVPSSEVAALNAELIARARRADVFRALGGDPPDYS